MNPGVGRFQSMDGYEGNNYWPLSMQKYLFGWNNPINTRDPSGKAVRIDQLLKGLIFPLKEGNARQFLEKYPTEIYIPPEVDIDFNIELSFTLSLPRWVWNVWPGHGWDYKAQYGIDVQNGNKIKNKNYQKLANLGNFNYGATGKAEGLSEDLLLRSAGDAEIGKYILTVDPGGYINGQGQGYPSGPAPYGDAPRDQLWIKMGFDYFNIYYASQ
jgi:Bacterial toxin 44